ncbi:hypothetical protein CPEBRM1_ABPJDJAI_01092 [Companilactobacillus paralimentarius]|uniref:hypothetical protein n=1 Tax=Companilactobacillus paralimentarius TaxID=83526 RepID=UPI0038514DC3
MAYNEKIATKILEKVFSGEAKPELITSFPLANQQDVLDTAKRLIDQGKIKAILGKSRDNNEIAIKFTD